MTRPIKFRVWNGRAMSYPKFVEIGINNWNGLTSVGYQLAGGGYGVSSLIMQYTGLKDKNGKEIYEGDIVSGEVITWEIYWDNKDAGFIMRGFGQENTDRFGMPLQDWIGYAPTLEVTSNIYENPELLEVSRGK